MTINYENLKLENLNYQNYLKVDELLALQQRISKPPHHDEMFFIIIHQAAELWFKLMLHESAKLVDGFRAGSVSTALKTLKRMTAVMDLQARQINLLNTLTPVEFAGFRDDLNPASGFQSVQFREMEFRFGIRNEFFLNFFNKMPEVVKVLEGIRHEPSVYDEFLFALEKAGYAVPAGARTRDWTQPHKPDPTVTDTIKKIYEKPGDHFEWVLLFEGMLDFDEKFSHWRALHMLMILRAIGNKTGTGGSTGYDFLKSRWELKCFPDLWEVRNVIGSGY